MRTITCMLFFCCWAFGQSTSVNIGKGPLADIPVSCTVGDVYYATDQSSAAMTRNCTTLNTWTLVAPATSGFTAGAGTLTGPATSGAISATPAASGIPQLDASSNLALPGKLAVTGAVATPASASAACVKGQFAFDTGFAYFCVNTNTWLRVAIATW